MEASIKPETTGDNADETSDVEVITFGCRLNAYESEIMKSHARDAGMRDTLIFNTCAVTNEATRQARQSIRRMRRENPGKQIIVTGCAAQVEPERFAEMDEVDLVIGNQEKLEAGSYKQSIGLEGVEQVRVNDIMSVTETMPHMIDGLEGRARTFIQIQNGCDHRCTFCIIPYGRGNSRSVPAGEIIRQLNHLVENGSKEAVLTGVDITSYGPDLPGSPTLGRLIEQILKHVPDLPRLRLSSIDSVEIDETLLRLIREEERLMPHLHLSLQAGDNMILKRMKRRHTREQSIAFCEELKKARPEIIFGADIIAGFPTETEKMFENSLRLVDECDISFLHVFPYSAKEGTPAARMPQLDGTLIKERAQRLREKGREAEVKLFNALKGQETDVLIEKNNTGHSSQFAPVRFDEDLKEGTIVRTRLGGHDNQFLNGQVI